MWPLRVITHSATTMNDFHEKTAVAHEYIYRFQERVLRSLSTTRTRPAASTDCHADGVSDDVLRVINEKVSEELSRVYKRNTSRYLSLAVAFTTNFNGQITGCAAAPALC